MKKFAFTAMIALAAGMISMPVIAADDDGEKKFTVHGEVRTRWERLENMTDVTDTQDNGNFDDTFSFLPYRARVQVHGQFTRNVEGVIEIQNFGNFGNDSPEKGTQFPPTASYGDIDNSEIDLYQAFVRLNEIGGSGFGLQIGRQEIVVGTELMFGDNDYYNGMSFDGLIGGWDFDNWRLHFGGLTIDDRNVGDNPFGSGNPPCYIAGGPNACPDDNVNVYYVGAEIDWTEEGRLIPYLIYYRDGAGTGGVNPAGILGPKFWTIGVNWGKDITVDGEGRLDWNLEAAYQSGDIDINGLDMALKAYIIESWIGWNFRHGDGDISRIGVGALMTSGDDDFSDQDAEAFIPLFTDIHANNRLGNLDFGINSLSGVFGLVGGSGIPGVDTGITDLNIRYNGNYGNHSVLFAYHFLSATTLDTTNVFITDPGKTLGGMLDIGYGYTYTKNVSFGLELSVFEPGEFFEGLNTGPPADLFESTITRVAGEVRLRF